MTGRTALVDVRPSLIWSSYVPSGFCSPTSALRVYPFAAPSSINLSASSGVAIFSNCTTHIPSWYVVFSGPSPGGYDGRDSTVGSYCLYHGSDKIRSYMRFRSPGYSASLASGSILHRLSMCKISQTLHTGAQLVRM